jgi:hypothetical protein
VERGKTAFHFGGTRRNELHGFCPTQCVSEIQGYEQRGGIMGRKKEWDINSECYRFLHRHISLRTLTSQRPWLLLYFGEAWHISGVL